MRFVSFHANLTTRIANVRNLMSTFEVNEFGDLSQDEFAASCTELKPLCPWSGSPRFTTQEYHGSLLASSGDWTTQGVMTPVMNQGQPWTCWSFSTTGTGNPVSFNEQQFVGCDIFDTGCNAGPIDYVTFAEKIARYTEGSYPDTAQVCSLWASRWAYFREGWWDSHT